jgi:two-component system, NarL family, sensor kinase
MFRLLRYYAAASFIAVLATAILLTLFYRQVAIQGIVRLAERSNVNLAQLAMNPIKPALLAYLDTAADRRPGSISPPLPAELARSIAALLHEDQFIVRIKIYNPQGVVVFSTTPAQIGDDQSRNQGFITAIRGGVGSELIYRDTLNSFEGVSEEDNLMQTYLPVRAGPAEPIRGVFELYSDVNGLVRQTEGTEFIVFAGALVIMLSLYVVLILIVRYASNVIEAQQRTISERNETLALLADHLLKTEESHKKKIAFELQEGVAQTLAAVKLKAEIRENVHEANDGASRPDDSLIPMLQEAIQEVRTIATDLRPASLDDLGLLPTINWLCRELEQRHPGISIERRISLDEGDVPAPLKGTLYSIVMSVLGDMAQHPDTMRVRLGLSLEDHNLLVLLIDDTSGEALDMMDAPSKPQLNAGFARMEELVTLSGGAFTAAHYSDGGTRLHAAWNRKSIEAEERTVTRRFRSA